MSLIARWYASCLYRSAMKPKAKGRRSPEKWQSWILGALLVTLALALAVPPPVAWGAPARAQERLFSIVGRDYLNPLLCSARGIQLLNSQLNGAATVAGYDSFRTVLSCGGSPEIVSITRYSGDIFRILGGEMLLRDPSKVSGNRVFLTESFWRRAFFGTPDILGQSLRMHGEWFEVAGVIKGGTEGIFSETDIWVPISSRSPFGTMTCFRVIAALGGEVDPTVAEKNFARALRTEALKEQVAEQQATRLLPVESSVPFEAAFPRVFAKSRDRKSHDLDSLGRSRSIENTSII